MEPRSRGIEPSVPRSAASILSNPGMKFSFSAIVRSRILGTYISLPASESTFAMAPSTSDTISILLTMDETSD
jgi:hypothetical protein